MMMTCRAFAVLILGLAACSADEPVFARHEHGPHDGLLADFSLGDTEIGWVEVKLHDDKGDIEVWLGKDKKLERPFDLPTSASIRIEFLDEGEKITLRPRDTTKNEDEDGRANIRDGKTNYFVFPGKAGEDASWLKGKDFKASVEVRFERDGKKYRSSILDLQPHTH